MSEERNNLAVISPEEHLGVTMDPAEPPSLAGPMGVFRPTPGSNVIVDDSPLQNQMERNKECKSVSRFLKNC